MRVRGCRARHGGGSFDEEPVDEPEQRDHRDQSGLLSLLAHILLLFARRFSGASSVEVFVSRVEAISLTSVRSESGDDAQPAPLRRVRDRLLTL
jgi:hypothetical protein